MKISMFDPKFLSALRGFFAVALKEREFNDQKQFQSVASWYRIKTKSRGEQRNKDSILLTMTNEMTEQFLKYVEPYFVDFLISKIMTNNNFLDGSGNDFRTGPIPIEAYVSSST